MDKVWYQQGFADISYHSQSKNDANCNYFYFSADNSACYKFCYNNWARWEGSLGRILILSNDFYTVEALNNDYFRDNEKWPL